MPEFQIHTTHFPVHLKHAFTISRGTKSIVTNVAITITANDITGIGEAAPNRRFNEDAETVDLFMKKISPSYRFKADSVDDLLNLVNQTDLKAGSAAAALEMAWWDWYGKSLEQPLWKLWGLESSFTPPTSFTIGIDEPALMQQKVIEAEKYPVLKIKLGTGSDSEIVKSIRKVTDKPLRVDANEGWDSLDKAMKMITYLADQNVELVEQPMPAACHNEMIALKKWSPVPLYADESFTGNESLELIKEQFHGINIKLMKIGSLNKARITMYQAREAGLQVMTGCMIESSLAISAGALIGLNADIVDLDGFLLIDNDPFCGLILTDDCRIKLPDESGLGIKKK